MTKEYDTEREIRDAYDRLMDITTPARIERYRAAVRAETLREVRVVVEKMHKERCANGCRCDYDDASYWYNQSCADLLTALAAMIQPL
jgi:hypothetical protein